MKTQPPFRFKQFEIEHHNSAMKVGTDGVLLGAWANTNKALTILDIGTGTGLIALMLAQRQAKAIVHAVEIDDSAYTEAKENAARSPWSERINITHQAIQHFPVPENKNTYNLIVSNPPYFFQETSTPISNLKRQQARQNITLSQDELIQAVIHLLDFTGKFCIILPVAEAETFILIAAKEKLFLTKKAIFFSKRSSVEKRLILEFSKKESDLVIEEIVHYEKDGRWTAQYKALTHDFHINL